MQILAPAKINLSLRILRRRADGFHEIESLIAPVSLYDKLDIQKQNRWIDFNCDDPSLSTGEDNLVVRAAKLFLAHAKIKGGVSIKLQKKIPHGAGLGGGSSDAAATLRGLDEVFKTRLSREELAKMATTIGSDVPFFLYESAAHCKGRGEIVEPVKLKSKIRLALFKPAFGVPTAWAYVRWQGSTGLPAASNQRQERDGQTFVNDLERPVFEKFVFLARLKNWLLKQKEVSAALMSGSGSTVFAVLRAETVADDLVHRVKALERNLCTCLCETI